MIFKKLLPILFAPLIQSSFIKFITDEQKIQVEIQEGKCLSAIKPSLNDPYKYVVTTDCGLNTHFNSLTWEKIEEHEANDYTYFKIKSIHDSRTGKSTKCIGFIDENPKAILTDCDDPKVQFFRLTKEGRVISKPKPRTHTEKCLIIEDIEHPHGMFL